MPRMHRIVPALALILVCQLFTAASPQLTGSAEQVRAYTRSIEFDYIGWTLNAAFTKLEQLALNAEGYLKVQDQSQFVRDYVALVQQIQNDEG